MILFFLLIKIKFTLFLLDELWFGGENVTLKYSILAFRFFFSIKLLYSKRLSFFLFFIFFINEQILFNFCLIFLLLFNNSLVIFLSFLVLFCFLLEVPKYLNVYGLF